MLKSIMQGRCSTAFCLPYFKLFRSSCYIHIHYISSSSCLRAECVICFVTLHYCGEANAAGSHFLAQTALTHRTFLNIQTNQQHHNSANEPLSLLETYSLPYIYCLICRIPIFQARSSSGQIIRCCLEVMMSGFQFY
jgi:hypothetical protein